MKVLVDPDLCIACGDCIETCPEVFDWNDDGLSNAIENPVSSDHEDCAKESVEICPTEAIKEN